MLDEAGPVANTPESQNVFVCGKDRTGEFFLVDPTKDEIKVSAEETSSHQTWTVSYMSLIG